MKKIIQYGSVRDQNLETLDKEVNNAIANGWQPYGSITAVKVETDSAGRMHKDGVLIAVLYIQPMVKYED